jgi:hypothetical protein
VFAAKGRNTLQRGTRKTKGDSTCEVYVKNNGYPKNVFGEIEKKRARRKHIEQVKKKEFKDVVVIPYVAGLSAVIRRAGDEVGVKTVFSANDTLKKRLTHVKPKSNTRAKVLIYRIPCECGAKYIGETGRPLETRVSEDRRNLLKLSRDREIGIEEESLSSLLATHAAEN